MGVETHHVVVQEQGSLGDADRVLAELTFPFQVIFHIRTSQIIFQTSLGNKGWEKGVEGRRGGTLDTFWKRKQVCNIHYLLD